jgi:hypothetical protein
MNCHNSDRICEHLLVGLNYFIGSFIVFILVFAFTWDRLFKKELGLEVKYFLTILTLVLLLNVCWICIKCAKTIFCIDSTSQFKEETTIDVDVYADDTTQAIELIIIEPPKPTLE